MRYYLDRDTNLAIWPPLPASQRIGAYEVLTPAPYTFRFVPGKMHEALASVLQAASPKTQEPRWVFSLAWRSTSLLSRLPPGVALDGREHGPFSLFRLQPPGND
jgi:hypothetical protein